MDAFTLDPTRIRDLSRRLLDDRGRLRVVPARDLATTTPEERLLFGVRHGLYGFPTQELVDFLRARIAVRSAIEIGAGHGVLAQALGIPATDNRQQEDEDIQAYYRALGQPTVPYGDHVEKLDAAAAIAKYRPQVVIACWVTHRLEAQQPEADGSATGMDEAGCRRRLRGLHRHRQRACACPQAHLGDASREAHTDLAVLARGQRQRRLRGDLAPELTCAGRVSQAGALSA